jgi:hypothetical protein
MTSIFWAQAAAVTLVLFAGMSLYQLTASYPELEEKALRFAELASEDGGASLKWVRFFAYGLLPLAFIVVLLLGGLSPWILAGVTVKVMASTVLSLWIENRLLLGEGYSPQRHQWTRWDSIANLGMTVALIYALLHHWIA